jgi:hypothetical protein
MRRFEDVGLTLKGFCGFKTLCDNDVGLGVRRFEDVGLYVRFEDMSTTI